MARPLCGCGCGIELGNPKRLFIPGHDVKTRPAHLTREARALTNRVLADEFANLVEVLRREPETGWERWRRLGVLAIEQSVRLARRGVAP